MLVTERFWFFRRPQLRGGLHAIFYSLPDCSMYYKEVVDALPRGGGSVLSLVTKYDKFWGQGDAETADRSFSTPFGELEFLLDAGKR